MKRDAWIVVLAAALAAALAALGVVLATTVPNGDDNATTLVDERALALDTTIEGSVGGEGVVTAAQPAPPEPTVDPTTAAAPAPGPADPVAESTSDTPPAPTPDVPPAPTPDTPPVPTPDVPPAPTPDTPPVPTPDPGEHDCPEGTIPVGDHCAVVDCIGGYVWNGDECVPYCPEGATWNGSGCDCPGDTMFIDGDCELVCVLTHHVVDGECVPYCFFGEDPETGECLPFCLDGYEHVPGHGCLEECPDGFVRIGAICIKLDILDDLVLEEIDPGLFDPSIFEDLELKPGPVVDPAVLEQLLSRLPSDGLVLADPVTPSLELSEPVASGIVLSAPQLMAPLTPSS